jgi:hypothetical protein
MILFTTPVNGYRAFRTERCPERWFSDVHPQCRVPECVVETPFASLFSSQSLVSHPNL